MSGALAVTKCEKNLDRWGERKGSERLGKAKERQLKGSEWSRKGQRKAVERQWKVKERPKKGSGKAVRGQGKAVKRQ